MTSSASQPQLAADGGFQPKDAWLSIGLFIAALLPRLYVALQWAKEPVWDGHYYHFGATRIAEGLGYSEDVIINGEPVWKAWCHYPVGYSGMLGIIYKLLGTELWVAPITNAVFGALTVVLVYLMARHYTGLFRATIAGCLCAAHPGLIAYTALLMTEPLSAFTLLLGGVFALYFSGRRLGWFGAGLSLGLGALVRPTALLALPWLLFAFVGKETLPRLTELLQRPKAWLVAMRSPLLATLFAGLTAAAAVAPWTARNCAVMDGCALISTNGGWNLAIGAVTETGRFSALKAEWGCPGPGQVQQDRCWGRLGRERIAESPLRWLGMIPKKLAHTYNHESFAVGYLGEADPKAWPEERKNDWRRLMTVFHHVLMFAAALSAVSIRCPRGRLDRGFWVQSALLVALLSFVAWGLARAESPLYWTVVLAPLVALLPLPGAPRRPGAAIYAWGLVLMTSVTHAIFFGDDRYHLTISPVLCMLAAGALRAPHAQQSPRPSTEPHHAS